MFFVGFLALGNVSPTVIMFVWDGLVLTFLFVWMTGLVTELQRSESLSLTKFLHLPVSATGVFLINYLSSLFSITMLIFGPAMLALVPGTDTEPWADHAAAASAGVCHAIHGYRVDLSVSGLAGGVDGQSTASATPSSWS